MVLPPSQPAQNPRKLVSRVAPSGTWQKSPVCALQGIFYCLRQSSAQRFALPALGRGRRSRPARKRLRRRKLLEMCAESPASGARFVRWRLTETNFAKQEKVYFSTATTVSSLLSLNSKGYFAFMLPCITSVSPISHISDQTNLYLLCFSPSNSISYSIFSLS